MQIFALTNVYKPRNPWNTVNSIALRGDNGVCALKPRVNTDDISDTARA